MANLALSVKCSACFDDVDAEMRVHNYETVIFVGACTHCSTRQETEAHGNGYVEGREVGLSEGYEACEQKYKDDVRAAVQLAQEVCKEEGDAN